MLPPPWRLRNIVQSRSNLDYARRLLGDAMLKAAQNGASAVDFPKTCAPDVNEQLIRDARTIGHDAWDSGRTITVYWGTAEEAERKAKRQANLTSEKS